jgi:putative lipase involved disintegration of autophagic bodies
LPDRYGGTRHRSSADEAVRDANELAITCVAKESSAWTPVCRCMRLCELLDSKTCLAPKARLAI